MTDEPPAAEYTSMVEVDGESHSWDYLEDRPGVDYNEAVLVWCPVEGCKWQTVGGWHDGDNGPGRHPDYLTYTQAHPDVP